MRESTILGYVGAGGIGMLLFAAVNTVLWREVSAILLLILVLVVMVEWITSRVRKRLIQGQRLVASAC